MLDSRPKQGSQSLLPDLGVLPSASSVKITFLKREHVSDCTVAACCS